MLEVKGLVKEFPSVRALDGVDLELRAGEVHGIVGENGAGKSTLMKILAGLYQPSSGEVLLQDKPVRFRGTGEAIGAGIAMIHQELNLVDELSAAENIFLGREPRKGPVLDRDRMNREAKAFLDEVHAPFAPNVKVGSLSIAGKQLVEIAKALSYNARILIMDEPTAVLSERETSALFELIRKLKSNGVSILYISHLLPELIAITDRITVLRDGRLITTLATKDANEAMLANLMVGRELEDYYPPKRNASGAGAIASGEYALAVKNLSVPGVVHDLSFAIRPGEILGLAGLVGSGRTEAAEAICGLRHRSGGTIERNGNPIKVSSVHDAMRNEIAYVSEDRKQLGLITSMSTANNVTLANLRSYARPIINGGQERRAVAHWTEQLGIKAGNPNEPIYYLSGGNQQKVSVSKWLDTKPKVLILDEPTRGVDVGAKREIYNLIANLAEDGLACLVISSEMPELIGLCHRILVLREGRLMGELIGEDMTEQKIMALAAAVQQEVAA
ncbi:MAG TPA: sugar ABC transporter ATP-binding protein [Fimbriimonas sp.]|nr:sugar ABC transporter ATP-binding protein [Fimbriimonas sp.]